MIIRLQDFQAKKHRRCPERIIKSRIYIYFGKKKKKMMRSFKTPTREEMGLQQWWIIPLNSNFHQLRTFVILLQICNWRVTRALVRPSSKALPAAAAAASVSAGLRIPSNTILLPSLSVEGRPSSSIRRPRAPSFSEESAFCSSPYWLYVVY